MTLDTAISLVGALKSALAARADMAEASSALAEEARAELSLDLLPGRAPGSGDPAQPGNVRPCSAHRRPMLSGSASIP